MEPPMIGAHCYHERCHNHDFLPTKCLACNHLYCRDHYFREAHNCEAVAPTVDSNTSSIERAGTQPCALEGCSNPCLESYAAGDVGEHGRVLAICFGCSLSFCAYHRFPSSHSCQGSAPPDPPKNEDARALLAKNFPVRDMEKKGNSLLLSPAPDPKTRQKSQRAKLVQLMKMRQTAIAGDPKANRSAVDLPDRFHVQVKFDKSGVYKAFWFRKSMSIGRAFDLLQQQFDVSPLKSWTLLEESDGSDKTPTPLSSFDRPLSEEFEDGCKLLLIPNV